LYGILAIDGDILVISWTEFFYRKVVGFPRINSCVVFSCLPCMVNFSTSSETMLMFSGFSPKVGFPRINSCVVFSCLPCRVNISTNFETMLMFYDS
jgi:hypothetical protein